MRRGMLLCAAWWFAFAALPAHAGGPALAIRGPRESEVRAGLERTLLALDLHPSSGVIDVELKELGAQVVRYQVRIKRGKDTFQRVGIARPDELVSEVSSAVLLGVLARKPDVRPRVVLVVAGDRPAASAIAAWKTTLQQRGFLLIPDAEVNLARSTLKKADEPEAALAETLGVRVVAVELRNRGNEVAVQTTVFDENERRGQLADVATTEVEAQVGLLLDFLPIQPRRVR